jgi:hypothetical protein
MRSELSWNSLESTEKFILKSHINNFGDFSFAVKFHACSSCFFTLFYSMYTFCRCMKIPILNLLQQALTYE